MEAKPNCSYYLKSTSSWERKEMLNINYWPDPLKNVAKIRLGEVMTNAEKDGNFQNNGFMLLSDQAAMGNAINLDQSVTNETGVAGGSYDPSTPGSVEPFVNCLFTDQDISQLFVLPSTTLTKPFTTDGLPRRHVCEVCEKEFLNKTGLTSHLKVHTGYAPYNCQLCLKRFFSLKRLKEHQLSAHTSKSSLKEPPSKRKPWFCGRCKKCFPLKDHRDTHVLTCVVSPEKEKQYKCETCGLVCENAVKLNDHLQLHLMFFQSLVNTKTVPHLSPPVPS